MDLRAFSGAVRRKAGYQLYRVQQGQEPSDWRPVKTVGSGVREIRIQEDGQYRVIYVSSTADAVHVLHAFRKKTRATPKQDIEIAKRRLKQVTEN